MLEVRDAVPGDHAFLVEANQAMALETEGRRLPPEVIAKGVRGALSHPERAFYLVAQQADKPVGTLMVTTEWSDWRNGTFWWIQSVYVAPDSRGQGVYRALHGAVEERARSAQGVCGLRLYVDRDNERARRVYELQGMEVSNYDLMEVVW